MSKDIPYIPPIETEKDIEELMVRADQLFSQDSMRCAMGERKYRSSWRKRGGTGAYENIARKMDRIEAAAERNGNDIFKAIIYNPASDGKIEGKDGLLDDIRDLRIYLGLVEDVVVNLLPKCGDRGY